MIRKVNRVDRTIWTCIESVDKEIGLNEVKEICKDKSYQDFVYIIGNPTFIYAKWSEVNPDFCTDEKLDWEKYEKARPINARFEKELWEREIANRRRS